jgi:hypothetical protein
VARARARRPSEAFIAHASADQAFANRLVDVLRARHVPAWYSSTNIVGAQQWHDEIGAALARCDWFVVVLSRASIASPWVKHELLYALNDRRYQTHIVPILYRPCNWRALSWTLNAIQMIDFRGSFAAGCRELLRVWGLDYEAGRPR